MHDFNMRSGKQQSKFSDAMGCPHAEKIVEDSVVATRSSFRSFLVFGKKGGPVPVRRHGLPHCERVLGLTYSTMRAAL